MRGLTALVVLFALMSLFALPTSFAGTYTSTACGGCNPVPSCPSTPFSSGSVCYYSGSSTSSCSSSQTGPGQCADQGYVQYTLSCNYGSYEDSNEPTCSSYCSSNSYYVGTPKCGSSGWSCSYTSSSCGDYVCDATKGCPTYCTVSSQCVSPNVCIIPSGQTTGSCGTSTSSTTITTSSTSSTSSSTASSSTSTTTSTVTCGSCQFAHTTDCSGTQSCYNSQTRRTYQQTCYQAKNYVCGTQTSCNATDCGDSGTYNTYTCDGSGTCDTNNIGCTGQTCSPDACTVQSGVCGAGSQNTYTCTNSQYGYYCKQSGSSSCTAGCQSGYTCSNGQCVCPVGQTSCGGSCQTTPSCGTYANGNTCYYNGAPVCSSGSMTCSYSADTNKQCASSVCTSSGWDNSACTTSISSSSSSTSTTTTSPPTSTTTTTTTTPPSPVNTGLGKPIITPPSPVQYTGYNISCPANSNTYNCINAYANNANDRCRFTEWLGNSAQFSCNGMPAGSYKAQCQAVTGTTSNCQATSKKTTYIITAPTTTTTTTTTPTTSTTTTTTGQPTTSILLCAPSGSNNCVTPLVTGGERVDVTVAFSYAGYQGQDVRISLAINGNPWAGCVINDNTWTQDGWTSHSANPFVNATTGVTIISSPGQGGSIKAPCTIPIDLTAGVYDVAASPVLLG